MNIPYDTGKVKIGLYYQKPKYIEEDGDMLRLQSYLIYDPALLKRRYWESKIAIAISALVFLIVVVY